MQEKVFEELFEKYLQKNISEAEQQKLMEIIQTGTHDNFIKEKIELLMKEDQNIELLDKQKSDDILQFILSQATPSTKVIPLDGKQKSSGKLLRAVLAVAAVIMVLFAVRSLFFDTKTAIPSINTEQSVEKVNPILAYHGKQLIHLPDGSTILLNENSSIEYNQESFNTKTREVSLSGEAYFDIKRNEQKPFIVHTGKVNTKVLGTAFNIKTNSKNAQVEVTVERGKVQVGDVQKVYGVITPNQQIKVNTATSSFEQNNNVSAAIVMEWKSKYLILDNINMEEAIAMISQKYKVSITLSNQNIKNCRITASFLNDEDLDHILKVVCSVIETEYHYTQNGAVLLEGKGCE